MKELEDFDFERFYKTDIATALASPIPEEAWSLLTQMGIIPSNYIGYFSKRLKKCLRKLKIRSQVIMPELMFAHKREIPSPAPWDLIQRENETIRLLEACKMVGIKVVAIRRSTNKIPHTAGQRPNFIEHSIFSDKKEYNGHPAIWHAVITAGLKSCCGNHHQYQINDQCYTGVYEL